MNHLGSTEFPLTRSIYLRAIHILNSRSRDLWLSDMKFLLTAMNALTESLYAQELENFSDEFANRLIQDGGWQLRHLPDYMRDEDGVWHISHDDARSLLENWPDLTRLPDGYPNQKLSDIEALEEVLFQRRKNQEKNHPTEAQCYALTALEKISLVDALLSPDGKPYNPNKIPPETLLRASKITIEAMEMACTSERKLLIERLPPTTAAQALEIDAEILKNAKRAMAQSGAKNRWRQDPKTLAKQQVKECWELWQKNPTRYESKAHFARDMLAKYEELKNPETIQRWCRD